MFFRQIRTYQEKRFNERDAAYVRGRRNFRNLPDGWDDYRIDWYGKMSWKSRTRKKKSWLRGKLKHKWWFLQELLNLESERVDEALCHPEWIKWNSRPCRVRWEMYREISEKELKVK